MACEHKPVKGLDKVWRCRLCGLMSEGPMDEVMATVQSQRQARRLLSELAKGWKLKKWDDDSAAYTRTKDGMTEELGIEKKGERQWQVVKRVKEGG